MAKSIIENLKSSVHIVAPLTFEGQITQESMAEMLRDDVIATHLAKIQDFVLGTKIKVTTESTSPKEQKIAAEIERDINMLTNGDLFKKELVNAVMRGYTFNEVVYGHNADNNLVPKSLENLPSQYVRYDYTEKKFYVTFATGANQWLDNYEGMMQSIYQPTLGYEHGLGLLEELGVTKLWQERQHASDHLNAVVEKYGGVVTAFAYDPTEAETDEGQANLKARADGIKATQDGSVIAVPVGGYNKNLKDSMQLITLDNLKPETLTQITDYFDKRIEKLLTGAVESSSDGGSYAREEITNKRQTLRSKRFISFVEQEYRRVLELFCEVSGIECSKLDLRVEKVLETYERLELETSEANRDKLLLENTLTLSGGLDSLVKSIERLKFLGIANDKIVNMLGVDPELVTKIEAKEPEVGTSGAAKAIAEFSKKLNIK